MKDNGDGSYYVYIEKGSDFDDNYYAYIYFKYTPSTNTVDFDEAYIYLPWSGNGGTISGYFYTDSEVTNTLNVTAFDFNAGTISLNYTGQSTASFDENTFFNQPMRMTFNYSGKLFKYNYSPTTGPVIS
jgi:hypothetical protein